MLRRLIAGLFFVLISSNTSYAVNSVTPILKINDIHGFFPAFSEDKTNYALYNCHKKNIPFTLTKGSSKVQFNDFFVNDQVRSYKGVSNGLRYDFTVRCLNNGWKSIDYKYKNYSKSTKGFILGKFYYNSSLVTCPDKYPCSDNTTILYIVDNYGVPMWYRYFKGHSNFTGFQLKGSKLEWFATNYKELPPQNKNEISGRVLSIDLKENSIISNILPYEVVNNVKVYPPIDYHDYKSTDKHFYFISYVDKLVNPKTVNNIFSNNGNFDSNLNPDLARKEEICKSSDKVLIRETRVIRTDKKGLVDWSFEIKNVPTFGVTINIREEKGYTRCEIDVQHPNWLSLDANEKNITVSLHNSGTYNIDINKKEINWVLYNEKKPYMRYADIDTSKLITSINDPAKGVSRTHSGSFNKGDDLFLTFDNRLAINETSRAVIYKIDKKNMTATFVKSLLSPENKCSMVNSSVYCMTRTMGNATYSPTGEIIVNWGEKPGGKNVYTVYDKDYKVKLDVLYGFSINFIYKNEYYDISYFKKNFFSYDFLKSTNSKNNYLLYSKSDYICEQIC
jgi:hypothetical protein